MIVPFRSLTNCPGAKRENIKKSCCMQGRRKVCRLSWFYFFCLFRQTNVLKCAPNLFFWSITVVVVCSTLNENAFINYFTIIVSFVLSCTICAKDWYKWCKVDQWMENFTDEGSRFRINRKFRNFMFKTASKFTDATWWACAAHVSKCVLHVQHDHFSDNVVVT